MTKVEHLYLPYLDDVVNLAESSSEFLVPNNRMIYYLACTVFSKYSFVAIKENVPAGFLFSVPNMEARYIWLHQIAVNQADRRIGIGSQLIDKLEELISREGYFDTVKCAIKSNNSASKTLFSSHGYSCLGTDDYLNMEIFEKHL